MPHVMNMVDTYFTVLYWFNVVECLSIIHIRIMFSLRYFLTFLQSVISLFLVCHQGSWRSQALLAEHFIALPSGPEEDDHCHQQHAAQYAHHPPQHSEFLSQFRRNKQLFKNNRLNKRDLLSKVRRMSRRRRTLPPVYL